MSRDQKPGRANIFDGSANRGPAAPPITPPAAPSVGPLPSAPNATGVAPVRVRLFVILFVAASAIAGVGVAVLPMLSS